MATILPFPAATPSHAKAARQQQHGEHLPIHPRRAAAHKRRQRRQRLPFELQQLVPSAVRVLVTPVHTGLPDAIVPVVTVWDARGRLVRRPAGCGLRMAAIIQAAQGITWDQAWTWHLDGNRIEPVNQWLPASLRIAS